MSKVIYVCKIVLLLFFALLTLGSGLCTLVGIVDFSWATLWLALAIGLPVCSISAWLSVILLRRLGWWPLVQRPNARQKQTESD